VTTPITSEPTQQLLARLVNYPSAKLALRFHQRHQRPDAGGSIARSRLYFETDSGELAGGDDLRPSCGLKRIGRDALPDHRSIWRLVLQRE